ncbi:uncharacterized protein UDID_17138 [Ustilago sp. UG-2017a]|nr:uncharacterized protein UDID_17138 [Ustilago sp. UG-2017a]
MPPRVDSIALLERTMQMIREAHTNWDEDQVLEHTFLVMNLQPNTNQAEKIPRSVLSIVSQIVKLNENNWAIWEPMFMDCICPIKNARRILAREIPSGHTNYDEELDSHLLGLIMSSCDHGPTSRIDTYTVWEQGEEEQLGSTLYKKLKAALTINDKVKLSTIHDRVHEVKLVHRNIANLGKELDQIWNNAARLGSHMDKKLKESTLYHCIKDDWLYTQTVDSLKAAQPGCSYEYAYHALAKKHQEAELSGRIRAAARVTSNRNTTGQTSGPGQILNQEGYNRVCSFLLLLSLPLRKRDHKSLSQSTLAINSLIYSFRSLVVSSASPLDLALVVIANRRAAMLTVATKTVHGSLTLELHITCLSKNLLSIQALTEDGARVIFEESGATILQHDGSMIKSKTNQHKKRWEVYGDSLAAQLNDPLEGIDATTTPAKPASHTTSKLWHEQFGHPGRNKTKQIQAHYLGKETQLGHDTRDCNCCSQAKQTRARMTSSKTERAQAPLELVHIDLMTDLKGHPNYHHTLVVVDDLSSYVYVKPLLSKAEAFPALKAWIKAAEIATDHMLKCICSDNGTEWSSFEAEKWKQEAGVRGRAPETQVSADLCGHSIQRWLGTISIDMKVMMTPRSGVSADGDEVDDVGDEVVNPGPQWTTAFGSIYIRTANLLWAPSDVSTYVAKVLTSCMRRQRHCSCSLSPESTLVIEYCTGGGRGPSSTTPVLLSCIDSFDTAPPPQDLLAGLLCTAPPPSTGDVLGPPCIRAGPPCPWSPWRLHSPWRLPSNHACYQYQLGLWPLARPSLDLLWPMTAGFRWQKTTPYVSAQNGRAERMIRSLQEKMRAMLVQRSVPKELWPYTIMAAGHTLNLTPSAKANRIPYEDFHRKSAHGLAKQLCVFGCLAWVHLPKKDHAGKHGARAIPGIMVSYDDEHKGWKFFTHGHTLSIRWSNSATFHEAKGWHDRPSVQSPLQFRPETDSDEPELEVEVLDMEDPLPKIHTVPPTVATDDNRSELDIKEIIGEAHTAALNLTPTLKEALASDDAQQRQEAIHKELDGLEAMGTWEIVDVPPNTRLVDSKIVLQLKLDADGIPVQHKARLIARGFTQQEGIDFKETFAPVAPLSTIRALLSLAVEHNWEVHQLDITMAYLNSTLKHVIYMKPPEGAKVSKGKAYRVVKGLYGLQQSGWEWNMEFDKFLRRSNFHRLNCAPCIYTRGKGDNFAIVVIYVDDMLIIAPNLETVKHIKEEIGQRWRMEEGGNVSHFLRIKITRD